MSGFADWKQSLRQRSHPEGDCRIWDGPINNDGYGVFNYVDSFGRRRSVGAHKAAFLAAGGTLRPGEVVRHIVCHRTLCIEPKHLAAGTQKENLDERKITGTWARRGVESTARVNAERPERLKAMAAGISARDFAAKFGIGENAAFQWLRRWRLRSAESGDN